MKCGLAPGYSAEIDTVDKSEWERIIDSFDDANIYQTWSYEAVRSGEGNLSHLLVKKEGELVAAAQVRLAKVPFSSMRVAYLRWGPMWRRLGRSCDVHHFAEALRALRNEYVVRRGHVLRILPVLFDDEVQTFHPLFVQAGFGHPMLNVTQCTLIIDLRDPVEELRKGLHEKWRYNLKSAEKKGLRIEEGSEDSLFQAFLDTYRQTHERKKFLETSDVTQYRRIQEGLPPQQRMRILVAYFKDVPAAGVICSCLGKQGVFLYGGTSTAALDLRASYLLQWRALNWIKEQGATSYNIGGINRSRNPGTYQFKTGLCGKNGKMVRSLGSYDAYQSTVFGGIFQCADLARVVVRDGRITLRAIRSKHRWPRGKMLPAG